MYQDVIGIVGGMGSYATAAFFERLLDAFPAEKEWDRPRILVDNRCTMPSRVRAILYREKIEELVDQLSDSVQNLINMGATKIVLVCNTSHYFLPCIYERVPQSDGMILNIIETTADKISHLKGSDSSVSLLASEGTIDSRIFHTALEGRGITVQTPTDEEFGSQREIIEAVKQRKITEKEHAKLASLICSAPNRIVILGCTEFPVLLAQMDQSALGGKIVVDPLECVIERLQAEIK